MSEHLSALALDEIASGLAPASEHVTSCAQCAAALTALRAQNAAFLARPEARAQQARLAPSRRSMLWLAPALAAGVALFVFWPNAPTERIKGSPTVVLLDAAGNEVTRASEGQRLTLAVGGAGASSVKVSAVDANGKREPLFAGEIAPGPRVPVMELEVTPGDVTVIAEFDDGRSAQVRLSVP